MKNAKLLIFALGLMAGPLMANVNTVTFSGGPSTSWVDGTFSTNLSGDFPDGFYALTGTSAYNGYGQNGEFILFNSPQQIVSLGLEGGATYGCCALDPTSTTALLYNSSNNLLASQTVGPAPQTLTFNTPNVSKIVFDITGGQNVYGDGRPAAWYVVSNVEYEANATPEPSYLVTLAIGFLVGAVAIMRRKKAAQA
jgi:hypothetical protein